MKKRDPDLLLFHAPLLRQGMTTPSAMRDVLLALMPASAASLWFFGVSAAMCWQSCRVLPPPTKATWVEPGMNGAMTRNMVR